GREVARHVIREAGGAAEGIDHGGQVPGRVVAEPGRVAVAVRLRRLAPGRVVSHTDGRAVGERRQLQPAGGVVRGPGRTARFVGAGGDVAFAVILEGRAHVAGHCGAGEAVQAVVGVADGVTQGVRPSRQSAGAVVGEGRAVPGLVRDPGEV